MLSLGQTLHISTVIIFTLLSVLTVTHHLRPIPASGSHSRPRTTLVNRVRIRPAAMGLDKVRENGADFLRYLHGRPVAHIGKEGKPLRQFPAPSKTV